MVPGMAWQSGIPDMLAASSMAMPAICIDATCVSESSLGQAYIANATCEKSKVTTRPLAIQRPHCVTMRLKQIMGIC